MRKLLAIIFLMIFAFQVLPVKAIGKLLSKAQTEEEVKQDCSGDDDCNDAAKFLDYINHTHNADIAVRSVIMSTQKIIWHYEDELPSPHVDDIPSPPPNC